MSDDDLTIETDDESLEGEGASASKLTAQLKKLREELKKVTAERQEYLEGWQRAKADYVNVKRRAEEERGELIRGAALGIVRSILPVLDSFDHALEAAPPGEDVWIAGIKNTKTQLLKALEAEGVAGFDPIGEQFDPARHEPVGTVAVSSPEEDNIVTKTYQKGYTLHGTLVRPARVAVGHYQNEAGA